MIKLYQCRCCRMFHLLFQTLDACCDSPTFNGHIDYGKEASQLHSLLVDLLDKVDNKVTFWTPAQCLLHTCTYIHQVKSSQVAFKKQVTIARVLQTR